MPPKHKYANDWAWDQTLGNNYTAVTNTATSTPITYSAPHRPARPLFGARVAAWFKNLGLRLASERGGGALPMMGGGAPDAETERRIEHKKKIVLERSVGVPRDKGQGVEKIHEGTVTLVRTVEGDVVQTGTIGIACRPKNGNYVEIPVSDLLGAVKELADEQIKTT